jgi:hypothetical protein
MELVLFENKSLQQSFRDLQCTMQTLSYCAINALECDGFRKPQEEVWAGGEVPLSSQHTANESFVIGRSLFATSSPHLKHYIFDRFM